ncbi:MAG: pancreas/duodenum homeobox protein 1, partial [Deltaproteobacteria bacterium]|nr:pancreas/duodenum homeobox protein 1 [Deltaproteobacteria bacterium]
GVDDNSLTMELLLHERPGCCLACNLTQGLPQVFSRHPVIGINSIVEDIDGLLENRMECGEWSLGNTEQRSSSLHVIPIKIALRKN